MPETSEDRDTRVGAIKNLYLELLEREADDSGLNNYVASSLSIEGVREALRASSEFRVLLQRKGLAPLDIVFIEPSIAVSGSVGAKHSQDLITNRITHVLDISDAPVSYSTEGLAGHLKIPVPASAVISISDTKKCMFFIKEFISEKQGRLLIASADGDTQATGMLHLLYVAQGMDEVVSETLILSCRPTARVGAAFLGPWHFAAAKKVMEG